jgi:two-component system, chemotaxis family, protein-glutamate methylesterase/glutaminase
MPYHVLIVEDSAFMRAELVRIIERDPELKVIATARDGRGVLDKIARYQPDVVTLDINMPHVDGLEALRQIMAVSPRPVLMISTLTEEGAEQTLDALNLGAFDFIHKPSGAISLDIGFQGELIRQKVKTAAWSSRKPAGLQNLQRSARIDLPVAPTTGLPEAQRDFQTPETAGRIVGIGVSTGGPNALATILPQLPADFSAAVVIAQHMPRKFTPSFSKRLDTICRLSVKEAENGEKIRPGVVYIAPGGTHTRIRQSQSRALFLETTVHDPSKLYQPSVEILFESMTRALGNRWLGVMLTGMGDDGAEALVRHHRNGGHTIAEAERSCVVYGMPRKVVEMGGASDILPLDAIADRILKIVEGR